ncbi:uncharacterized protein LOC127833679 [Dreissena polymorpha]|nr:uncharacterized protein LOC127833679 [Dreissena polymorpha]
MGKGHLNKFEGILLDAISIEDILEPAEYEESWSVDQTVNEISGDENENAATVQHAASEPLSEITTNLHSGTNEKKQQNENQKQMSQVQVIKAVHEEDYDKISQVSKEKQMHIEENRDKLTASFKESQDWQLIKQWSSGQGLETI